MKKENYLKILQNRIDELKKYYENIPENDYAERGITLGKISAYYDAIALAHDIEY